MKTQLYLVLPLLLLNIPLFAQEASLVKKMKSIEILKATRIDIERIFGRPEHSESPYYHTFKFREGTMNVEYAAGPCNVTKRKGWNVPEFTVTSLFLTLSKHLSAQELGLSSIGFRKYPIKDVPGAFVFENEAAGMEYTLTSKRYIESVSFSPKKKYDDLYCEGKEGAVKTVETQMGP